MSLRILSVAPPLVSLFFFSAFVIAENGIRQDQGVVNVTAKCTSDSFSWTFNSINQSPCIVAAYMLATCFGGSYTLPPLPPGDAYGPDLDFPNECECSTVGYSLMSACATCQERDPFPWAEYVSNCTSILPPLQFPNPVPAEIYVPHWVILNVTKDYVWNAGEALAAGGTPEYGPGAIFGASGVYTSSASASSVTTSSASASSTAPPIHSHSRSHVGAIAGSIGGFAIIFLIVAAYLFNLRRKRLQSASEDVGVSQPMLNNETDTTVTPSPGPHKMMKLYDPNDPTTFPGYQAAQAYRDSNQGGPQRSSQYLDIPSVSQLPSSSRLGSRTTLVEVQASVPNTTGRGYRGLPMPHS